jgi:hypothetical protein
VKVWNGFIWLRMETSEQGNKLAVSMKGGKYLESLSDY